MTDLDLAAKRSRSKELASEEKAIRKRAGCDQLDVHKARRVGLEAKRVNVDFPSWMVDSLDREARRMGVTRQSLIKLWLADRLALLVSSGRR
jgi:hypothetical protein